MGEINRKHSAKTMTDSKTIVTIAGEYELPLVSQVMKDRKYDMIILTGEGVGNVIKTLNGIDRNHTIINIGYAGSPGIPKGTKVKIGTASIYHRKANIHEATYQLGGDTYCFTSSDFVEKPERCDCVYDMELAFICALGFEHIEAWKVVSDSCDYNEYKSNESQKRGEAGEA